MKKVYLDTSQYMVKKLPLPNPVLRYMSALDPNVYGHYAVESALEKLKDHFPTTLTEPEEDQYLREIAKIQLDPTLPSIMFEDGTSSKRVDKWWAEIFSTNNYPALSKIVKACLSVFTGPQVEQSFSSMNLIINSKTNRLDIQTYCALQSVRYELKAKHTTALDYYHREDVVRDPVDRSVARHMQTAYSRYKKRLHTARLKRLQRNQTLKPKKPKGASAIVSRSVHVTADRTRKMIKKNSHKHKQYPSSHSHQKI